MLRLSKVSLRLGGSLLAFGCAISSGAAFAQDAEGDEDTIIVTGVFGATALEDAPISISVLTAEELRQQAPASAADILRSVPGVFVNSSLGEIRNVVFSRGVSANSLDGSGGYYYISLQEDGLPVDPLTQANYGPDYFSRPDIMLDHLEALRGGTATITASNAPGGVFNYVSRTGRNHPGYEVSGKLGLEGDGRNPYYRLDAYAGGELGEGLYYAIGGFYRQSDGARDPGYPLNEGGQVRANLLWDYGDGTLTVDAKYLDDNNGWFEFLPATNFSDPTIPAPFTNYDSVLPAAGEHSYTNPDGSRRSYDASNLINSQSRSAGLNWEHEVGIVTLNNRARYTRNTTEWNTGAVIFGLDLNADIFPYIFTGTFGIPGTIRFYEHGTTNLAAQIQSFSGFDHTVVVNNLPGQNVFPNAIFSQAALDQDFTNKTFQNQFTANLDLGSNQLAIGASYAHSSFEQYGGSAGFGLSGFEGSPQNYDITLTLADNTVLKVTDPSGYAAQGGGAFDGDGNNGSQETFAIFAGDTWQINDVLSLEAGGRWERVSYDITNKTLAGGVAVNGGGGLDNNPLTLWDNRVSSYGADTNTDRSFDYFNYSLALNYQVSDDFQVYGRYTQGRKAPDYGAIQGIDEPQEIANLFPEPQRILQVEFGLKYQSPGVQISAYPFYSRLSNVADNQIFIDQNNLFYSPPPVYGEIETYGLEIEGDFDLTETLSFRTAITVQNPTASGFGTYLANTPGRSDDTLVITPDGDADNNPKLLARSTLTYTPVESASLFLTHNYVGKRAANRANAWYMPSYQTFDLGGSYQLNDNIRLQANVNNLFNNFGVMSWARAGGFFDSLDRQGLSAASVQNNPNQLFYIVPIQPRSFWLTATLEF